MCQNMLPSVSKWYHNELSSFRRVKITIILHLAVISEIPNTIKLLPNAIKHSTQATKIKMCQNMLPSVTKWYYKSELPSFLSKSTRNHNDTVLNTHQRASYQILSNCYQMLSSTALKLPRSKCVKTNHGKGIFYVYVELCSMNNERIFQPKNRNALA